MRKLWISLGSIAALMILTILAVPFCMGVWVQKNYPSILSQLNTPHITFALTDFKRGWFNSRAQLQITFQSAETTLGGESLPLTQMNVVQNIQHGPLVRQKNADGIKRWVIALAQMQNETQSENLNFKSNTLWTLKNNLNTELNIEHLLLGNERQRIEIHHLTGNVNYIPLGRHFQSMLTLESGALFENNPEKIGNNIIDLVKVMEINHFSSKLDIRKIASLWYGGRHFEAAKIMIFPYGRDVITAHNFTADLNQNQHDQLTDFNLTNQIEAISDGQFKIGQFQLALILKDMNSASLENFTRAYIYSSDFQRLKLYTLLVELFEKGMTVDLKQFKFTAEEGTIGLHGQITIPLSEKPNPGLLHLLENLNIQAEANMPKAWLKKNLISYYESRRNLYPESKDNPENIAQQYLDFWQKNHLLVFQNDQVIMAINYNDGKLLINGEKPMLDNFIFKDFHKKLP